MLRYYESDNKIMYNIFALIFSIALMAILAIDKHYNQNKTAEILMSGNLTSPVLTIVAFNVFAIYKKCADKIKETHLTKTLISLSFMIYLIHPVFIHLFNRVVSVESVILSSPPVSFVLIIMVFVVSAIASNVINLIIKFTATEIFKK